jgi:hypothetical protein
MANNGTTIVGDGPENDRIFDGLFLSPNTHWFARARSQLAEMV